MTPEDNMKDWLVVIVRSQDAVLNRGGRIVMLKFSFQWKSVIGVIILSTITQLPALGSWILGKNFEYLKPLSFTNIGQASEETRTDEMKTSVFC